MSDPTGPKTTGCTHPMEKRSQGPRIPRVYGSGWTQVCECGMWRTFWNTPGPWRPADTLAEAMEEDDGR